MDISNYLMQKIKVWIVVLETEGNLCDLRQVNKEGCYNVTN